MVLILFLYSIIQLIINSTSYNFTNFVQKEFNKNANLIKK